LPLLLTGGVLTGGAAFSAREGLAVSLRVGTYSPVANIGDRWNLKK
jgi:hypothetical protein